MNNGVSRNCPRTLITLLCVALLMPGELLAIPAQPTQANQDQPAKIPGDQLDSLVAPIALYPDPLLSQTLVASTYPLEVIQLQQWLAQNKTLKDKALADAVKKQDWDPSIQAMSQFPDLVKQLAENIKWTTDLGNAFLAQQNDVMDAVQRMRAKAAQSGNLKSTQQQKVETKVVESKTVYVIQPASTEIVYVPSYNPTVVYGAPAYPYPPVPYPPPPAPGAYVAGMAVSFGVGMAVGAAASGGWGYGSNWGGNNNVTINNNNNYVNNSNRQNVSANRTTTGGSGSWQHNPQHRGGAPYSNQATASKYSGTARGDSMQTRQNTARQDQGNAGGQRPSSMDRSAGSGRNSAGSMDRASADRAGGGSGNSGAFGGAGSMDRSSARASSQRGSSSMGGSRGGGGGGGGRSGGGGRRR